MTETNRRCSYRKRQPEVATIDDPISPRSPSFPSLAVAPVSRSAADRRKGYDLGVGDDTAKQMD
jgi:hypothetical protein